MNTSVCEPTWAFHVVPAWWAALQGTQISGSGEREAEVQAALGHICMRSSRSEEHLLLRPSNNCLLLNNSRLITLFFLSQWGALCHFSTMHEFFFLLK